MYGPIRTWQGPALLMNDHQTTEKLGLTNAELAVHPTVYAADLFRDKVVLVSGGAGGIGRAIVWLFARLGAHVAVIGRNQDKLDALVAELAGQNLRASAHVADIREPDAINALYRRIAREADAVPRRSARIDHRAVPARGERSS